jgi:type IV secretory pathway VirB2 component (pilin)
MDSILNTITGFLAQYWAIILFVAVLIILIKAKHKIKKAVFLAILIGAALFASGVTFFNFQ